MKPVRLLLYGAVALVAVMAVALLAVFSSGVQTWAVHRVLAGRPELGVTVGSVSAGLGRVELRNVRVASHGAVVTLPALEADLPLLAAGLKDRVTVTRLVAKGWTLDLTKAVKVGQAFDLTNPFRAGTRAPRKLAAREFSLLPSARAADAPAAAAVATGLFQGIFAQLALPVDLALDGVSLEGEVILPSARGHARVALSGGGLAPGREGKFELGMTAALTSTTVASLETHATLTATMDTPRTFSRLGLKGDATASGSQFPRGVKLSASAGATRAAAGEDYALMLATADKQLVDVRATFPLNAPKLSGTWKIDARDADLAPFLLGRPLPPFVATGEGQFDFDGAFAEIHARGKLHAASDNLTVVRPELAALGALEVTAEFDLTQLGDQTRIDHLRVALSGVQPVATIHSLQSVTYNRVTHGLAAADPARDLFNVALQGVPLAWARPFAPRFAVGGGDLKGEFVATAADGGFSLRPKAPLTIAGMTVAQADKPLLRALDVSLNASVDYTPHGWQVSAAPLVLRSGDATLLTLDLKAGQLAGPNQPIKATGKFSAALPALLAQPVAGGALQLSGGELAGDFVADLGTTQALQARLAFTHLVADPRLTTEQLPAISADLRADIAAGGQVTVNAPLLVERAGRKSDLALTGTFTPGAQGLTIAARLASNHLVIDDVKILAAPLAPSRPGAEQPSVPPGEGASASATREAAPPWAGVNGQVALALREVVYSNLFQATDVAGTLTIDAGALKFEGVRAGLGNGSEAKISGGVTFDAQAAAPYALAADLAVTEFDPAPLFKALNPGQPPTVEGRFNIASKLSGQARRLDEFATATHGDFQLSSKGGVFHGLPVAVAVKNEAVGKLAQGVALVGSALDVFKGRKEESDVTSLATAVAEISKLLAAITYDQLSVSLSRDARLNTVLKDFTLISPEIRLTGGGQATHQAGTPLLDETLAMEFKLRARGRTGDLLKYLGRLEAQTDELGYAGCTLPLKVGGTLGRPDTGELNHALATLALEKSGVKDKAGELLNKLFGK